MPPGPGGRARHRHRPPRPAPRLGFHRGRHQLLDVRGPSRYLQLDLRRPGQGAGIHRGRRGPFEALRQDAGHGGRGDPLRHRPRGVEDGDPAHRLRGPQHGLHGPADTPLPAHGRERLDAGGAGGRVPPGLLRRVPFPRAELLRAHARGLRGGAARDHEDDRGVRVRRRDGPRKGLDRHHRGQRPRPRGDDRRRARELGHGHRRLRGCARGLVGPRHTALPHGDAEPDPAVAAGARGHAPGRRRVPQELRLRVPRGAHHHRHPHRLSGRAGRAQRGERRGRGSRGQRCRGAQLRAPVPRDVRAADPLAHEERLLGQGRPGWVAERRQGAGTVPAKRREGGRK